MLVVDLAQVRFLSSRGLGALIEAHLGRRGMTAQLHLTGVIGNRVVARVIDVAGMSEHLRISESTDPEQLAEDLLT